MERAADRYKVAFLKQEREWTLLREVYSNPTPILLNGPSSTNVAAAPLSTVLLDAIRT